MRPLHPTPSSLPSGDRARVQGMSETEAKVFPDPFALAVQPAQPIGPEVEKNHPRHFPRSEALHQRRPRSRFPCELCWTICTASPPPKFSSPLRAKFHPHFCAHDRPPTSGISIVVHSGRSSGWGWRRNRHPGREGPNLASHR